MRAVFLDYDTVSNGDLNSNSLTAAAPGLTLYGSTTESEADARLAAAELVLLNKFQLTRRRLDAAPDLKLVCIAATGTDNVDLAAARERRIAVCNVRAYCSQSVMQQIWSMILTLTQHVPDYVRLAHDGSWSRSQISVLAKPIRELSGLTYGVIGWGELGRAGAKPAQAFDMRVIVCNRVGGKKEAGRYDLDDLLTVSDVVSLHYPLNEATRGLIGARELSLMKPDALLINTARGGLIDGPALAAALRAGRLGGAAIDVLAQEPPSEGDPLLDPTIPNLIVTPHVAWAAREARQRCLDEMAANIENFLVGGRRSRVD